MKTFLVTYFEDGVRDAIELPVVQYFVCEADDPDHAIEQTKDSYSNANILGVYYCTKEL